MQGGTCRQFFLAVTMLFRKLSYLQKTVVAASGIFRDVCSKELPYHTAEELWEGPKEGDEYARLLFTLFLRLRKNERTRCSIQNTFASEGKRLVDISKQASWAPLFVDTCHQATPYQGKPKTVVAIEGSRAP